MSQKPYESNSIFWIDAEKVRPNPFQPRRQFDENSLKELAESIRMYGVLQPLTVTRHEEMVDGQGMNTYYELIAGERRLRASKLAGLSQVPAIIRSGKETDLMKLELAIIENLQREDLNPIDRAIAFKQLSEQFGFTHSQIGKKMGRSREYISNSLRLISLPEEIQNALRTKRIAEGHARPLLMLRDNPQEQMTVFKEILFKNMSVRDAEKVARKVAKDKVRVPNPDAVPKILTYEEKLSESLGTRVSIESTSKKPGGKIVINYFSNDDLDQILTLLENNQKQKPTAMLDKFVEANGLSFEQPKIAAKSDTNQAGRQSTDEGSSQTVAPKSHTEDLLQKLLREAKQANQKQPVSPQKPKHLKDTSEQQSSIAPEQKAINANINVQPDAVINASPSIKNNQIKADNASNKSGLNVNPQAKSIATPPINQPAEVSSAATKPAISNQPIVNHTVKQPSKEAALPNDTKNWIDSMHGKQSSAATTPKNPLEELRATLAALKAKSAQNNN